MAEIPIEVFESWLDFASTSSSTTAGIVDAYNNNQSEMPANVRGEKNIISIYNLAIGLACYFDKLEHGSTMPALAAADTLGAIADAADKWREVATWAKQDEADRDPKDKYYISEDREAARDLAQGKQIISSEIFLKRSLRILFV